MARASRIPRQLPDLLKALDHHQYLLRGALYGLREDPAHIKTLATELRTLVCLSSGTEGLLWRVADELSVSDVMELDTFKALKRDQPLTAKIAIAKVPLHRPGEGPRPRPARPHRLRDIFKQGEAIYVAQTPDRIFTHELLIGAIAGQMGGAHEAEGLDPALVELNKLLINNRELYVQVLGFDAELTLQIGERVLDHAESHCGFCRASRLAKYGDVTVAVRFAVKKRPTRHVPVVTIRSAVSEAEILCSADPESVVFTLTKRGATVAELAAAYPADWENGADALFTLSYSSALRQARTLTNDEANGAPMGCDFRWLDARELRREQHYGFDEFLIPRCVIVFACHLSPSECGELLQTSRQEWESLVQQTDKKAFPD